MGKDLHNHIDVESGLDPVVSTGTTDHNCTHYDRGASPFAECCEHVIHTGASGDTLSGALYLDLILQHGDLANDSDMAAVTDAAYITGDMETIASGIIKRLDDPADDDLIYRVTYRGPKRYSRIVVDKTGTHTNGIPLAVLNIGHHPRFMGQNQMA